MKSKIIVQQMLLKYGEESQIDVAVEEMAELIKELIKYKRSKIYSRESQHQSVENVLDEISDVLFMFEYIKVIFNLTDTEITKRIEEKAIRTKGRYLDE